MRTNLGMRLSAVAMLAACGYSPNNNGQPDGPRPDGEIPDAGPCQAAGTKECVSDVLRTCVTEGQLPEETTCGWGCDSEGTAHCLTVSPSGGAVTKADLDPSTFTTLGDVVAGATIDTDAGTIEGAANGSFVTSTAGNVTVFRMKTFTANAAVRIVGSKAIAIVADGKITINAGIDLHGCDGNNGIRTAGPGGFDGGTKGSSNTPGEGTGGGGAAPSNSKGAGGGGHGGLGGAGGLTGGPSGAVTGNPEIMLLVGGSGGGGAKAGGGVGGGGGGAIQLLSSTTIEITTAGSIDAGGCGGQKGASGNNDGGGGGGAGGAILLEAPTIKIDGQLAVNGGGGGASDNGGDGSNGSLGRTGGAGGVDNATATAGDAGGAGGGGGPGLAINGAAGTGTTLGSGGGGAAGRIRFLTRGGAVTVADQNKLSPNLDDATTCTQGTSTIIQP